MKTLKEGYPERESGCMRAALHPFGFFFSSLSFKEASLRKGLILCCPGVR